MRHAMTRLGGFSVERQSVSLCLMSALFAGGALIGLAVRFRLFGTAVDDYAYSYSAAGSLWQVWPVLWSHLRWIVFAFLLGVTALGLFVLPMLVLFRGMIFGFAFSSLYGVVSFPLLLCDFLLTAVFTCLPLVLLSALGMGRGLQLCREGSRSDPDRTRELFLFFLFSAAMAFVCSLAEIWALPFLGS